MASKHQRQQSVGSATLGQIPWIERQRPIKIVVIGDLILDEYLDGMVNRISPEAPVPVHHVKKTFHTAGGAANVARNIKLAGGEVCLLGVCGDDEAASSLKKILSTDGIATEHILHVKDRPTVRKTRVSANNHQLIRLDWENAQPIHKNEQEELLRILKSLEFDALLLSDYGKGSLPAGFVASLIDMANSRDVPSLVDPKGKDYSRYAGAYLITPNVKEACDALGLDPSENWAPEELAKRLKESYNLKNVLLTLGPKGLLLMPEGAKGTQAKALHQPAQAREVFDVSGAGDTVVAIMALALGSRTPFEQAMALSNLAAGVVVGKWGTQPIHLEELQAALHETHSTRGPSSIEFSTKSKIATKTSIQTLVRKKNDRSQRVVFTNGCFDILHAGHVTYLEQARNRGDILVVGINSDESIRRIKGASRPFISLEHRMRLLAALECVDYVVPFDEDTPEKLIASIIPDVLIKGADWAKDQIVGADVVMKAGGSVETIELVPGVSTSEIAKKIRETRS